MRLPYSLIVIVLRFIALAGRALLCSIALLLPATSAFAANQTIAWGFSPTPTSVSIMAGESVTWDTTAQMGTLTLHPVLVTDVTFTTLGATVSSGGTSYTRSFPTPGVYYFMCGVHGASMPTTVNVCSPGPYAVLDVDGNGQVDATTDGVLTLRYLLGLRGSALTSGALGTCASRDAAAIETYLSTRVVP